MLSKFKKLFLGSVLVVMAVVLGACSDDTSGGGGVYSPSFDLGKDFTIASLGDKNFTQDTDNISKYSIEDISSVDTSKELIETELQANIKTKLEANITGTAVTFGDVVITGNAVAEDTLTVTVATTITETATATNTATNIYTFTIKFNNTLKKWDGSVTAITPTTDGVYQIDNGSHLAWIAQQTMTPINNDFAGTTVRFMNSVDMDNITGEKAFTGMGEFAGRLEGNHKTIYGLKIDKQNSENVGLIETLGNGGSIENLTIAKGSIIKGSTNVGAFVGEVNVSATVTIKGVTNHATVEGSNLVGGLVGNTYNSSVIISNSSNTGDITSNGTNGERLSSPGGLIGSLNGDTQRINTLTIDNSSNIGNVQGKGTGGGLVGSTDFITVTITNSHSYAKRVTGKTIGGIIGEVSVTTLTVNNVYWLHDGSTGIEKAVGKGDFPPTGDTKALNIAQFKKQANFKTWDFANVWEILTNGLYPTLKPVTSEKPSGFSPSFDLGKDFTIASLGTDKTFTQSTDKLTYTATDINAVGKTIKQFEDQLKTGIEFQLEKENEAIGVKVVAIPSSTDKVEVGKKITITVATTIAKKSDAENKKTVNYKFDITFSRVAKFEPIFDLGKAFTIASLGDGKIFLQADDNISKYSATDISKGKLTVEGIKTELTTAIENELEPLNTGSTVTVSNLVADNTVIDYDTTLTVTVDTTITDRNNASNTETKGYTFKITFAKKLIFNFDLGTAFTIDSLGADKTFTKSTELKYTATDITAGSSTIESVTAELKKAIEDKLKTNTAGTDITFGTVISPGFVEPGGNITITIETIITETVDDSNTDAKSYEFEISYNLTELTPWDGISVTEITPIEGGVYPVYKGAELAWIAQEANKESPNDFSGKTVKIINDIYMDNHSFNGIATVIKGTKYFKGKLEGNHKTIHGLNIDRWNVSNIGLIGQLGVGGSIENLTIARGSIIKGSTNVGAFVGTVDRNATVTIKGVTNHATVEGSNNVGGLVGHIYDGDLTIANSSNIGNVTGKYGVGGLVGSNNNTLEIDNSSNIGNVTGVSDYVGGLVGENGGSATITNSHSYAKIVKITNGAESSVGGIVGRISSGKTLTANNVYWLHDGSTGIAGAVGLTEGTLAGNSNNNKLTIAQFKVSNNFNGWDFANIWEILANGLYPTLKK